MGVIKIPKTPVFIRNELAQMRPGVGQVHGGPAVLPLVVAWSDFEVNHPGIDTETYSE
jgi:hypothetical protein